ncbi:MAG: 5'/3'-nucleotidase SurE [SAR324 cluster bacterium]|nr:5'/3'-nucleotidase SurE [SAR324 cluster bacterium]
MTRLLIVNDDGADSPLLRPLVKQLAKVGDVCVSVPLHENSWKAKAVTRYGKVRVQALSDMGAPAFAVDGTPADCANLGIHHLFGEPPDWVVAGINIGLNAGLCFVINSGTVGAALEAAITGLPAVAFSAYLEPSLYQQWVEHRELTGSVAEGMIAATSQRTVRMMGKLIEHGMPQEAMILNVNFPRRLQPDTPARWVPILDNRYGSLFKREGDAFVHAYRGDSWHGEPYGDRTVLENGEISVTPISLRGLSVKVGNPIDL